MAGMAALSHKLDALAEQLGQHAQASLSQVLQSVQTGNTALLAGPSAAAVAAVGDSVARAFREVLAKNLMPDLQRSLSASSSLPSPSTPPLSQQSLPSPSRHSSAGSMPGAPITPEGSVVGGNEPSCSHSMSGSAALMSNGNNSQPFAAEHLAPATAAAVAAAPAGGEAGSPVFADRADSSPLTTTQSNLVAALPAEATQQACHSESDQATLQATLEGLSLMQLQSASSAGSAAGRAQGERELQGATGGNAGQQQLSSEAQQAPQLIVLDGEHTTWRLTVEQQQQHLQHLQQQQQLLSLAGSNAQTHLPMLLPGSALASVGSVGSGTTTLRGSAPLPSFPSLPGPASGGMQGGYETLAGNLQARAAQMRRFSCEIPASASQALSAGPLSAAGGALGSSQQAGQQQQQQQQGQGGQALGTGAFRGLTISGGHLQSSQTLSELLHAAESSDSGAGRTSAPAQDSSQAAKATAMQQAQQAHVQAQLLQQQLLLSGSPHHPAAAYNLNLLNLANQQVQAQAQAQAQVQAQAVHQGGPFAMAAERELAALLAQQGLGDTSSASPAAGGASVGAFGSPGISQGLSPSPGPASGSVLQGAPSSGGMAPGVAAAFRSLPGTPGTRAMHDMFSAHLAAEQQQHQAAQQAAQQPRVQGVSMSGLGPGAGGLLSAALSQQHQAQQQQQQQQLQQAVEVAQQAALEQQQLEGYDRRLPNLGTLPHMHSMPAMHNISDLIMMSQPTIMEHTVLDDMDSGMNFLSGPQSTGRPHDVLNEYLLARQAHAQASHPGLQVSGGQIGSPMSNANLLSLIQQQQQQQQQGQRHLHNAAAAAAYAAAAAAFASAVNGRGPGMPSGGSVGGGVGLAGRPMEIPVRLKALPEMVQIRIMTLTATNNVISVKDFDEKVVNKICLLVDMHGAEEALAMLSHLEHRMRTKQGVMKNGPGYLDVAVSSHLDMLKAQGSCPRNMSTEEYAAHTLSPAVMHELKEAVGNNKWLEWEHLDQGIIQLIKKLPKDSAVEKLQEISYHSFKNVDNIKGCIMSILNSKIREDRRKQ